MDDQECRDLILQFIASLALCDHMGDVADDVDVMLKRLGIEIEWHEWSELLDALDEMGIQTLHGTELH